MAEAESLAEGPPPDALSDVFAVYETRRDGDRLLYFGEPVAPREVILRRVWPLFREHGYEVRLARRTGEHVVVAEPVDVGIDGIPWTNVVLAVVTVLSTLYAGSMWYYIRDPIGDPLSLLQAWPFAAGVLGVLGIHELGHYAMSRYHDVDATLPYFIPMPLTPIGTMGAVIKMKGQMPDRKALFDIGVAGPLAGLAATIVVTAIGLSLDPIEVPRWVLESPGAVEVQFGYPPLFHLVAMAVGRPLGYADPTLAVNPVVFGGWVGMFVTFLNLLPVGQLDGGHIVRSLIGQRQATVAAMVPGALFVLAGYLYYIRHLGSAVSLWVFWGLLTLFLAHAGPANPIHEEPLGRYRVAVGLATLGLGLLCFTPVPIRLIVGAG